MTPRNRTRGCRQRLMTGLLLVACLLFQQVAMAAYACTMVQMPPDPVAMAQDCEAMATEQARHSTAVCQKHCTPDPASASHHATPTVPALLLPAVVHALVLVEGRARPSLATDVSIARSDPPPRVRYCRLLI